jgi:hypothetical protein
MGIEVSITLFFIVAGLYIVIIEIFTIFFRITGMSREKGEIPGDIAADQQRIHHKRIGGGHRGMVAP